MTTRADGQTHIRISITLMDYVHLHRTEQKRTPHLDPSAPGQTNDHVTTAHALPSRTHSVSPQHANRRASQPSDRLATSTTTHQ